MGDIENLSREELIDLIKSQKTKKPKKTPVFEGECKYVRERPKNSPKCTENVETEWGYCKKHSRTVQGKKDKEKWEVAEKEKSKPLPPVENKDEKSKKSKMRDEKSSKKPVVTLKVIKKNEWGRYEDKDTNIVFDPLSKCAYAVQCEDGGIKKLDSEHIEICKRNKWDYRDCESSDEETEDEESEVEEDEEDEESEVEEDEEEEIDDDEVVTETDEDE